MALSNSIIGIVAREKCRREKANNRPADNILLRHRTPYSRVGARETIVSQDEIFSRAKNKSELSDLLNSTYGSLSIKPSGYRAFVMVISPSEILIFSPGNPMTRLIKDFLGSLGYLKIRIEPRSGVLKRYVSSSTIK